ncbi:hypothetical protein GCM10010363_61060 [Streptomyces omiyaensis]|uniref:hypothetical protein n=1 Tax=Streptomyces omiyaensis TaxID=68247 RepID=UPI00167AC0EB|nr:hypothetical protein [Streptomyces omiyaensis]GGY71494.1 hypothetical protein GCM10010363_61060 [Streptomyces omiyaensis]
MNSDPLPPRKGGGRRLVVLLLAVAGGVVAAQSPAWASAMGTAAVLYTLMSTGNPNRRS